MSIKTEPNYKENRESRDGMKPHRVERGQA